MTKNTFEYIRGYDELYRAMCHIRRYINIMIGLFFGYIFVSIFLARTNLVSADGTLEMFNIVVHTALGAMIFGFVYSGYKIWKISSILEEGRDQQF